MQKPNLPHILQSIGFACVPIHGMPDDDLRLARRAVAAAVLTLQVRSDGHREVLASVVATAPSGDKTVTHALVQSLVLRAHTLVSDQERAMLAVEAMSTGHVGDARLASLCGGAAAQDPADLVGTGVAEPAALCRRLRIPTALVIDADVEQAWIKSSKVAACDVALGNAIGRLMLWAHQAAFTSAQPDALFETLLPLREHLLDQQHVWPSYKRALGARVFAYVLNHQADYIAYRDARAAGDLVEWGAE